MEQFHTDSEPKYEPSPEELKGESWAYCYGQQVVIPPPQEPIDAHHQ